MDILEKIEMCLDEKTRIVYDCRGCDTDRKNKCQYKLAKGKPDNCPLAKEPENLWKHKKQ